MSEAAVDRSLVKTREHRFLHALRSEFELAPRVAEEILKVACELLIAGAHPPTGALKPGHIRQILAAARAPHGRPLAESQMVEVTWAVDAGPEDAEVLRLFGRTALRQTRLLRLAQEAVEQGAVATEEDLARALLVDVRTIRRDTRTLSEEGHVVPTRGKLEGIGRGQTHKVMIVGLFLCRHTYQDIQRRTRHSLSAIERYIGWFARVAWLHRRGLSAPEIAATLGLTTPLIGQYLHLLQQVDADQQTVLDDLLARLGAEPTEPTPEKGGLRR